MSQRELDRTEWMREIGERRATQAHVAERLGVSVRQVERWYRAYKADGAAGLISKKRGRPSLRRLPDTLRVEVLTLVRERYWDFLRRQKSVGHRGPAGDDGGAYGGQGRGARLLAAAWIRRSISWFRMSARSSVGREALTMSQSVASATRAAALTTSTERRRLPASSPANAAGSSWSDPQRMAT